MNWISVKDRLPEDDEVVDVYIQEYDERWTNYIYTRNYNGTKGNDFFSPKRGGLCCIRNASHWMYVPDKPKE